MAPTLPPLPVEAVLGQVEAALRSARACVLVAPTGAGKTTRLPPALDDAGFGPVVVLEPRRLAARAAARRVARERGLRLGQEVGYHVRFDRRLSARTRIAYVTEGVFLRRLQDDPFLEGLGCVVLDEFHERSLDLDLALALVRRVQLEVRPELRLVVTSATLDAEAVSAYLDDAPVVRSQGRLFPVSVQHLSRRPGERDDRHAARAVREALEGGEGDVLVFLPGVAEIRRVRAALEGDMPAERSAWPCELVELYGDLPPEAQDAALEPGGRRRVVLATNVAESSVTVPGVDAVVDGGLVRKLESDPALGLDRLVVKRVSLASAEQRAGRAGRERPGRCTRLWSAAEERTLAPFDTAQVRHADLTGVVLQLVAWGEPDLSAFPWFEPPPAAALEHALRLARRLGAIEETPAGAAITPLGRTLVRIPAQPRLARLLVAGAELGVPGRAAAAAALLGERDPRRREARGPAERQREGRGSESDVLDRVRSLEAFARGGAGAAPELHPAAARRCLDAQRQLERSLRAERGTPPGPGVGTPQERSGRPRTAVDPDEALLRALLAAFPDRLARRRPDDPRRGVLVGGRGVRLAPSCAVDQGELFLAVDLDAAGGEALVRLASRVERAWVDEGRSHTQLDCVFDPVRRRVVGRKRVLLGELVLEEAEAAAEDREEIEALLVEAARADLARALDLTRPAVASFLARLRSLGQWCPELELPVPDEAFLRQLLPELAVGCRSFADLARAPLVAAIEARLSHPARAALEREAPERLQVPSGSWIRLTYEPGRPPVLAARIQELFGLRETPRVARGRVPVLLHLLAPNGRAQQVTDDLESFWSTTYFTVRKELRQRYPKHDWPEDPLSAVARRRPARGPHRGPNRGPGARS